MKVEIKYIKNFQRIKQAYFLYDGGAHCLTLIFCTLPVVPGFQIHYYPEADSCSYEMNENLL
jgi:hypothetical protein